MKRKQENSSTIELLQLLKSAVEYCTNHVDFYRETLKPYLNEKNTIVDIEHFKKLPYTTKDDVKKAFPYGMLGAPLSKIIAYYESSGSTSINKNKSTKTASFLTKNDLEKDIARRLMNDVHVSEDDVVINSLPYEYTSCGLAFHRAYQKKGAIVIACNSSNTETNLGKQLDLAKYLNPTILLSAYPYSYNFMHGNDINLKNCFNSVSTVVICGIATSDKCRNKISTIFNGANVHDVYGLSEFGAVTESCNYGRKHIIENDFFVEIFNLFKDVDCSSGEIVITTLTREGSPKIRYRTGDYGNIIKEKCFCGRESYILDVYGRMTDFLIINDKKIFPTQIENIVCSSKYTNGIFNCLVKKENNKNLKLILDVEPNAGEYVKKREIEDYLHNQFIEKYSIHVNVFCNKPGTLYNDILVKQNKLSFKNIKNFKLEN